MKKKSIFMVVLVLLLSLMMGTQVSAATSSMQASRTVNGTLKSGSAYYKIKIAKTGYIGIQYSDIAVAANYKGGTITLLNSKKKVYCKTEGAKKTYNTLKSTSYVAVKKGTYYIKVSARSAEYNLSYTFKSAAAKKSPLLKNAPTLKRGKTTSALLFPRRVSFDQHIYKIKLTKAQKVNITMKTKKSSSLIGPGLQVVSQSAIGSLTSYISFEQKGDVYTSQKLKKGTYYIYVTNGDVSKTHSYDAIGDYYISNGTNNDFSAYYTLKWN